ncbi:PA14 domain-containing protein, partial [Campylobacter mucosalis]|uniref:PA14 domain-containing protein n=1 Tax=Campylobacter mucosalis TaxID=202 RepID=UPI001B8D90E5
KDTAGNSATITAKDPYKVNNEVPKFNTENLTFNVSEEGLSNGITDDRGDPQDTTNGTSATKGISSSDATFAFVTPNNTESGLTSGGVKVVWEKSGDNTMIGKASGQEVLKVTLNANTGGVNVILNKPVDHPVNEKGSVKNIEDVLSTSLKVKATNTFGSTTEADIKINIEDDSPELYTNANKDIEVGFTEQANVTLVLDFSASMLWGLNDIPGKDVMKTSEVGTRLEVAREKILKMLNEYQELGSDNVKISIVGFAKTAKVLDSNGQTWMNIAEAKDVINQKYTYNELKSLWDNNKTVNFDMGAGTNYDAALAVTMDKFNDIGKLGGDAKNKLYFISDGEPTVSDGLENELKNNGDSKLDNGIGQAEEDIWRKFLVDNKIDADAYMLSKDVKQTDLNPIAYDGINDRDKNARPFEDLKFEVVPVIGKIAYKDSTSTGEGVKFEFGADGAKEVSITITDGGEKGTKYTYDFATNTITPTANAVIDGSKFTITTKEGSKLTIDMKDGSYEYNAGQNVAKSGGKEVIGITYEVVDKDGDGKGNEKTTTFNFKSGLPSIVLDSYEDNVSRIVKTGSNDPVTIEGAKTNIDVDNSSTGTSRVAVTNDATPVLVFKINAQESGFVNLLNSDGKSVLSNAIFSKGDTAVKITIGADGKAESYATTSDGVTWSATVISPADKANLSVLDLREANDKFRAEITTRGGKGVVDVEVNLDIAPDTIQNLDASLTKNGLSYNLDFKGNVSDAQKGNVANTSKVVKIIDLDDLNNPTTADVKSNGDFVKSIAGITEGKNYLVEHTDAAGNVTRETYTIIKNSGLDVDMYFYNYRDPLVMTSTANGGESGYIQTGDNYKKWLDNKEPSATATADKLSFASNTMGKTNGDIDVNETAKFMPNNYTLREALPVGTDVIVKMDGYIYLDAPGIYSFETSGHNNKSTLYIDGQIVTSTVFQSDPIDGYLAPATGTFTAAKAGFYKINIDYVDMEGTAALSIKVNNGSGYKVVGDIGSGTHLYSNSYIKALEQTGKISDSGVSSTSIKLPTNANAGERIAYTQNGVTKYHTITENEKLGGVVSVDGGGISNVVLNDYTTTGMGLSGAVYYSSRGMKLPSGYENDDNLKSFDGKIYYKLSDGTIVDVSNSNNYTKYYNGWFINNSVGKSGGEFVRITETDSHISDDNLSENRGFTPNSSFSPTSNDLIGLKQNENTIEGSNLDEKFVFDTNKTIDAKGGTDTLIVMDNIDFTKVADLDKKLNSFEKIQMGANGKDGAVEMTLDTKSVLDIIDSVVTKNSATTTPIENVAQSDKSVNTVLKIVGDQYDVLKLKGFKQLTEQNEIDMLNNKHNVVGDTENKVDTTQNNVYKGQSNGETVYIEVDKTIKVVEIDI